MLWYAYLQPWLFKNGKCIGKYTGPSHGNPSSMGINRPRTNPFAIAEPRAASCTWMKITLQELYGGFLKWWVSPTTMGFPTKNHHFVVFWGYHHLRKHPYTSKKSESYPPGNGYISHLGKFGTSWTQNCHFWGDMLIP